MKDRWGVVYCLKGGEWSCLLLKGCLEDFKCKGLQMNPAYIHLTQILQMKRYDKYRLYIKICVCWIVFICPHNSVYFCLPVYFNFIFICLPVYLSTGLFVYRSICLKMRDCFIVNLSCLSMFHPCVIFLSIFIRLPFNMSVCLFIYSCLFLLFVYLSTCQRVYVCACLFVYLNVSFSILQLNVSVSICVYLSTSINVYNVCLHWIYVCLFVYKSIWLCICSSANVCLSL